MPPRQVFELVTYALIPLKLVSVCKGRCDRVGYEAEDAHECALLRRLYPGVQMTSERGKYGVLISLTVGSIVEVQQQSLCEIKVSKSFVKV